MQLPFVIFFKHVSEGAFAFVLPFKLMQKNIKKLMNLASKCLDLYSFSVHFCVYNL